jgi:tRNA dimethylallyltransferase
MIPDAAFPSIALAVLGPTAVGKSETAIRLASIFKGEIVSCDSVQVYRFLDIGSAKPAFNERKQVPHHFLDIFDPDFQIDVGIYKNLAEKTILSIQKRRCLPVVTGGTGLYFNSIYYGLSDAPARDEAVREELENKVATEGLEFLYCQLKESDPESAQKILPGDKRRIIRALEVYQIARIPLSRFQSQNKKLPIRWLLIGLTLERKQLYQRIENRVEKMLERGLLQETEAIMQKFGKDAFALGSIGYRHARNFLQGIWTKEEMVENLKKDTRHYAKRQMTWFRKNKDIHWFDVFDFEGVERAARDFLYRRG